MLRLARAFAVLAVAACAAACSATGPSSRVAALLGGADAVSVIGDRTPSVKREAYRLKAVGPPDRPDPSAPGTVAGYPILAGPVALDDASAASLADILLDDDTYLWDTAKLCAFAPGVAIRETRGAVRVDVLVCFSCDEVEIVVDGVVRGREDTDPRRADLVRIAQRLFPDDERIRSMK